jgi:hypothetical protein
MLISKGDMTEPNPDATSTLRAGQLAGQTTYFRNDLAFAANPNFSKDPQGCIFHPVMFSPPSRFDPAFLPPVRSKVHLNKEN